MEVTHTSLAGCIIIKPKVFGDDRGFFMETFQSEKYKKIGIDLDFVQDNRSRSTKNVLRGLHFQKTKPQGKLVTVTSGEVLDVAVDLRPESPTFGQYESVILNEDNKLQFYVPPGFAHGFCVLSDVADFQYKCTDFYDPSDEGGIIWNDETLNIDWKIEKPIISSKDSLQETFKSFCLTLDK